MPFTSFSGIFKTARRSVASEDYPELEEILVTRPPLVAQGAVDGLCALCNQEPATQEVGGTTVGDRCAERLMGVPTAAPTPYTEFGQKVYGAKRHRWQITQPGEQGAMWNSGDREKVCKDCGITATRYGNGRDSYWTFQRPGEEGDFAASYQGGTPPCEPPGHTAGILDWLDRKLTPVSYPQGGRWSFDWCRYRHNSHCFYPGNLNGPATQFAGYPVWTPQDRGSCPRFTWEQQEQCPIGAPGPNSGDIRGAPDAISLQQQQNKSFQPGGGGLLHRLFGSKEMYHALQGAPEPCANCGKPVKFDEPGGPGDQSECYVAADGSWECPSGEPHDPSGSEHEHYGSLKDPDFHWHFLAKWADVRAKAARIRKEGGVRIISAPSGVNPYIVAEVKGDHHTYQTTILRSLGRKSVAGWECTCAWAHYSWGRSGRWKKFEGRMCSHALATVFQAQADEMLGRGIKEVTTRPKHFENPADYTYKPAPYKPDWAVGRPRGTEGLEHAWQRTSALEKAAHGDLEHMLHTHCPNCGGRHVHDMGWDSASCNSCGSTFAADDAMVGQSLLASLSPERPIAMEVEARLEEGQHPNEVLGYLRAAGAPWPEYILTEALNKPFVARDPANELHTIVQINGEHALTDGGEHIPVEHLTHPEFDWHSGLEPPTAQLHVKSAKVETDPQPHLNADGSPHSGVMVALVPPEQVRQSLAVKDGEAPEDMHVTVGYLGKKDGVDPDALHRAMSSFAAEAPPLKGKVSGFGNFEVDPDRNDGYTHCHVGLVDIPGIAEFRAKLAEHLGREGLHIDNEHGLQPHISVAYGHEPAEYDQMPDTTGHFDLSKVTAAHGGSWTHYPLEGAPASSNGQASPKTGMLVWAADLAAGPLLNPHWQKPEPATGRSKGRADDPNATKFSTYEPEFKQKIAKQFHDNVPSELGVNTHRDMVENIKSMYREAKATNPNAIREGKRWYSDAHAFCKGLAGKYKDGNLRKSLGMTAALSPQCHWEENKTQAEYFHKHLSADPDSDDGKFNISQEDADKAMAEQAKQKSVIKGHRQVVKLTPGKSFADMDPEECAHSLKAQAKFTHKLTVPGRLKKDGQPWRATFANGTGNIAKAVRIHRGEDPDDVLQGHKVRSFFNNMADHLNRKKRDDVTADTHAVSLAAGGVFGASSPELGRMFTDGVNTEKNVTGTYGYVADAYRQAHKELVDSGEMAKTSSPHHLQATTWLHWRDITDNPGPLKDANKGRFLEYKGTNAALEKKFREEQARGMHQQVAASLVRAVAKDDPGELLDPSYEPEPGEPDPDFDPELAAEAEEAAWEAEPEEMARLEAEHQHRDPQHPSNPDIPHVSMLRWGAVQSGDTAENIDDDTTDAMNDAAQVQKDYQRQAEEAQDDWYFNQSPPPKSFDDSHTSIPVYMSALPYGTGMVRWAAEAAEEVLHDEPEGALPSTDGEGPSDLWQRQHAPTAQDPISATTPDFGSYLDPNMGHENLGYPDRDEAVLAPTGFPGASEGSTINDLSDKSYSLDTTSALVNPGALSQAGALEPSGSLRQSERNGDATLLDPGSPLQGADRRAWLLKETTPRNAVGDQGIRNSDIAAMARQFLSTGQLPEKTGAKVFTPAEQQELIQEGSDGVRASNLDRLQLEGTHYLAGDEDDETLEGLFD